MSSRITTTLKIEQIGVTPLIEIKLKIATAKVVIQYLDLMDYNNAADH